MSRSAPSRGLLLAVLCGLAACGGGSEGASTPTPSAPSPQPPVAPPPPVTRDEAFRFLNQATFGATEADVTRLVALGDSTNALARWIDGEMAKAISVELPQVEAAFPSPVPAGFDVSSLHAARIEKWFDNSLQGSDQLRQRVAWALSQIFVVSQVGPLLDLPNATAGFYDTLARDALGDYRKLLEDVTLHPAMGVYLSMLGNQKAVAGTNLRPDENYAREVMQLMSIGLVQLNLDGTPVLDANGQPVPTYDQTVIEGLAKVFTGWSWACPSAVNPSCAFNRARVDAAPLAGYNQVLPMHLYPDQHDTGAKRVLAYAGAALADATIPAGQGGAADLKDALDNIAGHPNVGPFMARQLIQKLVTSNPSPGYVSRVAQRFNDDGTGRRGNLDAVVRAILLDAEARPATDKSLATTGKVKEPLLRATEFWRAYGARSASGKRGAARNFSGGANALFGQSPNQSSSVFNFFSPWYAPPGEISDLEKVAPELQLATEYLNTQTTNFFWTQAVARTITQSAALNADDMFIETTEEIALAANSEALVNRVAEKLLGSAAGMSPALKAAVKAQVDRTTIPATNPTNAINTRVADAIYLIVSSPEYVLQR